MTVPTNPRNPWYRLSHALDLADAGEIHEARRIIEGLRFHSEVGGDIHPVYERLINQAAEARRMKNGVRPISGPADFLADGAGVVSRPFPRLRAELSPPKPYPFGMALPPLLGERNDASFLHQTAAEWAESPPIPIRCVHVIWAGDRAGDASPLVKHLEQQRFDGRVAVTVFAPSEQAVGDRVETFPARLLSMEARARLESIVSDADLVVFLSGQIHLDPLFIERASHLTKVSDNVVQPLVEGPKRNSSSERLENLFTLGAAAKAFQSRYPFREVAGLNMVVPGALLAKAGLPDPRFDSLHYAGVELAFRLMNKGAYLAALPVPGMIPVSEKEAASSCRLLYRELCPNHWDRKDDGLFEVPKVSVYIPAYNAARFLRQAVDSVLDQDLTDLEVCIADDGSTDSTAAQLEEWYADEPRVRWESGRNGGIGHASNRAIAMARGIYIGQLDSDDRLKPGAVRRLVEHLDNHPEVVCCYGSCERIDAEGNYLQDEYSWPEFTREKMMITSIAHHFRMFRRAAWERTSRFREDITNAVDYDIFLKLCETGRFHHINEVIYQRRWHGENTSSKQEGQQTANTYHVQREALRRQGLSRYWDVYVPNPAAPRRVTYRRKGAPMVIFWPDYSRSNPYQKLLYGKARQKVEVCTGQIDAALRLLEEGNAVPGDVIFHLHWLNFLFAGVDNEADARIAVEGFLEKLMRFRQMGGRVVWTVHNTVSHDSPWRGLEIELSNRLTGLADKLHFHSVASVAEVREFFSVPTDKLLVSRHGNYIGAYPDYVTRADARRELGISEDDDVILFSGQVRPYKGVEELLTVFRSVLASRPNALLLVAGKAGFDPRAELHPALSSVEMDRIRFSNRFIEDGELQVFCRAADFAVYPYRHILTSGSLLMALSFGLPAIVPDVGMTREVLADRDAGMLYDAKEGEAGLKGAVMAMLAYKDTGKLEQMSANARRVAEELDWPDFGAYLL